MSERMKRYRKYVAEKQLKISRCLLTGISHMMRQMQLPQVQRRAQNFMVEAETFSQNFAEMKYLRRQNADVECLLHLERCNKGKPATLTKSECSHVTGIGGLVLWRIFRSLT